MTRLLSVVKERCRVTLLHMLHSRFRCLKGRRRLRAIRHRLAINRGMDRILGKRLVQIRWINSNSTSKTNKSSPALRDQMKAMKTILTFKTQMNLVISISSIPTMVELELTSNIQWVRSNSRTRCTDQIQTIMGIFKTTQWSTPHLN